MILYAIIMFLAAVPMGAISIAIYRGKTNLIHDYHQTKVKDKTAYGKASSRWWHENGKVNYEIITPVEATAEIDGKSYTLSAGKHIF